MKFYVQNLEITALITHLYNSHRHFFYLPVIGFHKEYN